MSYETWLNYLRSAEKHSMISGRCRKVFYKFPDGQQMSEEYSMDTGIVQRRAWRKCKQLMGEPEWEIELGETPHPINQCIGDGDVNSANDFTLSESNCSPNLTKRITKKNIEWRIRNLPYPIEVYQVSADPEKGSIVVRTTNKKYYKVIPVPELGRCKLLPSQANIFTHHQYNTLIITYSKPPLLNEMEAQVLLLLKDVKTETDMEDLLQGLLAK
ncbi:protein DPCD [Anastrepha ludens]|uniref:protein DPCD n=1 Tax=Anastrepha ludens TaxID=28586 RepID=UPI0023B0A2F1|nr:protein DPCD [Anastrepha ludens]